MLACSSGVAINVSFYLDSKSGWMLGGNQSPKLAPVLSFSLDVYVIHCLVLQGLYILSWRNSELD